MPIALLFLVLLATPPTRPPGCYANMCGDENYCACHEASTSKKKRCWSTDEDCAVDLSCCIRLGTCKGMVEDTCTAATREKRIVRDAIAKQSTASKPSDPALAMCLADVNVLRERERRWAYEGKHLVPEPAAHELFDQCTKILTSTTAACIVRSDGRGVLRFEYRKE